MHNTRMASLCINIIRYYANKKWACFTTIIQVCGGEYGFLCYGTGKERERRGKRHDVVVALVTNT